MGKNEWNSRLWKAQIVLLCVVLALILVSRYNACRNTSKKVEAVTAAKRANEPAPHIEVDQRQITLKRGDTKDFVLSPLSKNATRQEIDAARKKAPWIKIPYYWTDLEFPNQDKKNQWCWVLYRNGKLVLDRPGVHVVHRRDGSGGFATFKILGGRGTYRVRVNKHN